MRCEVCVIIASDAVPDNQPFREVGPMSAQRIQDVLRWHRLHPHNPDEWRVWACGAGVRVVSDESGPTLSALNLDHLRSLLEDGQVLANFTDLAVWGTAEEIRWVITEVHQQFPDAELTYVFFTATSHMPRVRLVLRVLFPNVQAQFVETTEPFELSRFTELLKCGKVLWLWVLQRLGRW